MEVPTFTLSNGVKIPAIGYGTSRTGEKLEESLEIAIRSGYRQIDTAYFYQNEEIIGNTLQKLFRNGVVKREDLFITTKLHAQYYHKEDVEPMLRKQLGLLQLDYLDLFLIHTQYGLKKVEGNLFPIENGLVMADPVDHLETWQAMEEVYNKGLTKAIGLSNFSLSNLQRVYDNATVKPHNLQFQCHAYWPQDELYELCKRLNILVTAFGPLGSPGWHLPNRASVGLKAEEEKTKPKLLEDITVKNIGLKHNKTPAQVENTMYPLFRSCFYLLSHLLKVVLRWLFQRGINAIPKSTNPERIKENINIFDFSLSDSEFQILSNLPIRDRFGGLDHMYRFKEHPHYRPNEPH